MPAKEFVYAVGMLRKNKITIQNPKNIIPESPVTIVVKLFSCAKIKAFTRQVNVRSSGRVSARHDTRVSGFGDMDSCTECEDYCRFFSTYKFGT